MENALSTNVNKTTFTHLKKSYYINSLHKNRKEIKQKKDWIAVKP